MRNQQIAAARRMESAQLGQPLPSTKQQNQFDVQLSELTEQMNRLEKLIEMHAERIRPVCREMAPIPPEAAVPEPVLVPLADMIRCGARRLQSLVNRLAEVDGAVEL